MGILDYFSKRLQDVKKDEKTNNIPIIDISEDVNTIIMQLADNYNDYCNYSEILNINANERLEVLKIVWDNWYKRSEYILRNLIEKFPAYNKDDLQMIVFTEYWRLSAFIHANQDFKNCSPNRIYHYRDFFTPLEFENSNGRGSIIKELRCCFAKDMPRVQKVWRLSNGKINHIDFSTSPCWKKYVEKCFFFIDNEEKEMGIEEFENFCNQYNSQLLFPDVSFHFAKTEEEELKEWLNNQLKDIEQLEKRGKITEDKAEEFRKRTYKQYNNRLKRLNEGG